MQASAIKKEFQELFSQVSDEEKGKNKTLNRQTQKIMRHLKELEDDYEFQNDEFLRRIEANEFFE